jgi:hypothetical protein
MDIWESAIEQIKIDLATNEESAIYEMLQSVPNEMLRAYVLEANKSSNTDK